MESENLGVAPSDNPPAIDRIIHGCMEVIKQFGGTLRRILPKSVRKILRTIPYHLLPPRWRLPALVLWARLSNRLEDEMLLVDDLPGSRLTAVDAGANCGWFTYLMSRRFARVEAFEPNPAVIKDLRDYGAANVHLNCTALSSKDSEAVLQIPIVGGKEQSPWASFDRDNLPGSSIFREINVRTITLDGLSLSDVSLIKIDVEGHEIELLAGAKETIRKYRPVIIIEIKSANRLEAEAYFRSFNYCAFTANGHQILATPGGIAGYTGSKETFILLPTEMALSP